VCVRLPAIANNLAHARAPERQWTRICTSHRFPGAHANVHLTTPQDTHAHTHTQHTHTLTHNTCTEIADASSRAKEHFLGQLSDILSHGLRHVVAPPSATWHHSGYLHDSASPYAHKVWGRGNVGFEVRECLCVCVCVCVYVCILISLTARTRDAVH
jgi:hypothetical protein